MWWLDGLVSNAQDFSEPHHAREKGRNFAVLSNKTLLVVAFALVITVQHVEVSRRAPFPTIGGISSRSNRRARKGLLFSLSYIIKEIGV